MDKFQTIILALTLLLAFTQGSYNFLHQQVKQQLGIKDSFECDPDIPLMSVGHGILDFENIEAVKREHQIFVVVLTDSSKPDENCIVEPFLKSIHFDFTNLTHTHNENEIKIFRVDLASVTRMRNQEKDTFLEAPALYVTKDRRYHKYNGVLERENFISFLNKIINPFLHLKIDYEVEQFLKAGVEYTEYNELFKNGFVPLGNDFTQYKRKHRALMMLFEKNIIPGIQRKYTEAGESLANREDIRLALLSDRPKILNLLRDHKVELGDTKSKNMILLKNNEDKFMILDLEQDEVPDITEWLNKNSLDPIHELDVPHIAQLADMIKAPTIILFIDQSQASQSLIASFEKLAGSYLKHLTFLFVQDPKLMDLRYNLGIGRLDIPAVTIVTSKGILYPFRNELGQLNEETLEDYIKHFITGRIRPLNNEKFQSNIDIQLKKRLTKTQHIGLYDFADAMKLPDKDILVLFYTSESDTYPWKKSVEIASYYDTAAQRFKEHDIDSVECYSYDVYQNGLPEKHFGIEVPTLVLFPANHKDELVEYKERNYKTRMLMEFVVKYADIKIEPNERMHLPSRVVKVGTPIHDSRLEDL